MLKAVKSIVFGFMLLFVSVNLSAQINGGGTKTTADHSKQVIGYITNWDAWKTTTAGLPEQGVLNHLNIDYKKYTILNFSFFGVAEDGSLHSADWRYKGIWELNSSQFPAPLLMSPTYNSWDWMLLFGSHKDEYGDYGLSAEATAQGFVPKAGVTIPTSTLIAGGAPQTKDGWLHTPTGIEGHFPLPVKIPGAPGLLELAKQNGVKVMASIGGWSMSKHFTAMGADPLKRQLFIKDCLRLLDMGFDGIDLDWEFIGTSESMGGHVGSLDDYPNCVILVEEMRAEFNKPEHLGKYKNALITAAMSQVEKKLAPFDWTRLMNAMDYVNMMTYDTDGGWSDFAGHNSPLYPTKNPNITHGFSWDTTFQALLRWGVNPAQINMGLGFYGRGVVCEAAAELGGKTKKRNETVQPDGPIVTSADFTNWPAKIYDGTPNYFFIKQKSGLGTTGGWTRGWDADAKVPYLTNGVYFLSYDDLESIELKSRYVNDNQIAGVIVWQVFGDLEFSGTPTRWPDDKKLVRYSDVKCELINKVNEVFSELPAPTVVITAPAVSGQKVTAGAIVNIAATATATAPLATITKIEILVNDVVKTSAAAASINYDLLTAGLADGEYVIIARATDSNGSVRESAPVDFYIGNKLPSVEVIAPKTTDPLKENVAVKIIASASDADGTISSVSIQVANSTGTVTDLVAAKNVDGNYEASWTPAVADAYAISATAVDAELGSKVSAPVNVTVTGEFPLWNPSEVYAAPTKVSWKGAVWQNSWWTQGEEPGVAAVWKKVGGPDPLKKPVVTITAPTAGQKIAPGSVVTLTFTATDADGTVDKVDVYVDAVLSAVAPTKDASGVYSLAISGLVDGAHSIEVVATDNDLQETSASVSFSLEVGLPVEPWVKGEVYVKDDKVSHAGKIWVCGWWTTAEPGTTGEWGAWQEVK
jgi:chitinase